MRFNALSRQIESALQKEGIPNRVLGGHKFFERLEVCIGHVVWQETTVRVSIAGQRPAGVFTSN